jgi:hypothetical protein
MADFDVLRHQIIEKGYASFEQGKSTEVFGENYNIHNMTGTMQLEVQSSHNFWFIRNADRSQLTHIKNFLCRKRCADTIIWEYVNSKQWILHIIEMKRTVDDSDSSSGWSHIKSQFAVAYRVCRMVAVALDIDFDQVLFYTAFVNDKISSRTGSAPEEDPVCERPDPDMPDEIPPPWIE